MCTMLALVTLVGSFIHYSYPDPSTSVPCPDGEAGSDACECHPVA